MALRYVDRNAIVGVILLYCPIQIFRVLFDSPVYTWSQLLQGIWYTTPLLLSSGRHDFTIIRVRFRVRAEVKMDAQRGKDPLQRFTQALHIGSVQGLLWLFWLGFLCW